MANKLRVVYDNAVDRSTLVASSAVITQDNLKTDSKSSVWRTSGTGNALVAVWAQADELVNCIAFPFCNFSPTARVAVKVTNEAPVTNIAGSSEIFNGPGWSGTYVTVTPYAALAPDGKFTANKVTGNGVLTTHNMARSVDVVAGVTYTLSLFAKAAENSWMYLDLSGAGGAYATFNIGTGVVGVSGTAARAISPVVGMPGWYRVSITVTPTTSGAKTLSISTQDIDTGSSTSTSGGAYYWGVMMNVGSLSSYYPSLQTFVSRGSSGYYMGIDGLLVGVLSNVARMEYQYPSLATVAPRLLVEGSVNNLLLYSELLSNGVYTKADTTIGSAIIAPNGYSTALPVSDTTNNSAHYIQQVSTLVTATTYTLSMYVKASGRTRIQLQNGSLGAYANINLSTGTIVSTGGAGYVNSTIDALLNNWFRVSLTFTTTATSSQSMVMYLQDAAGSGTFIGTGSSAVYSWGWQLEAGRVPTSYIPSSGSIVGRSADVVTTGDGVRPAGYMDWWQPYTYSSSDMLACQATSAKVFGLTAAQSASAYSYGGGTTAVVYIPLISATGIRIDISDPSNLQGYLEASRLVVGKYYTPTYDAEMGASITPIDTGTNFRTDAGNLMSEIGTRSKSMEVNLETMTAADRTAMWKLVSYVGTSYPVFMSLYPENTDKDLEQAHTVYGKFSSMSQFAAKAVGVYTVPLEIEGI